MEFVPAGLSWQVRGGEATAEPSACRLTGCQTAADCKLQGNRGPFPAPLALSFKLPVSAFGTMVDLHASIHGAGDGKTL